jgi:type II secretory ATPase GspE/PulE/Tfp pilus assembly ATPase PilB-like protein
MREQGEVEFVPMEKDSVFAEIARQDSAKMDCADENLDAKEHFQEKEQDYERAIAVLDSILLDAKNLCSTDIHLEDNSVRFRCSGSLKKHSELSPEVFYAVVQRIKYLARMNVTQHLCPQDGQFTFIGSRYGKKYNPVFFRVSCLPVRSKNSFESESVVLRLLDPERMPLSVEKLGFTKEQLLQIEKILHLRNGLVLVCGPTGSGKSTTLASMMAKINILFNGEKKIISLEDPPEYIVPGVSQVAISSMEGMDFSSVLKRTFRQDPDILMIGEIRDSVTAKTAITASLTGHLVFATMHTSSVELARLRLMELGAEPAILEQIIRAVIIQNLEQGIMTAEVNLDKSMED